MRNYKAFLWLLIALGIVLRFVDISVPDLSTDEAQFIMNASPAHPPIGKALFQVAQIIGGHNIVSVRVLAAIIGTITIGLIFLVVREIKNTETAMIAAAIASIFPSHILFSRLAYLSIILCFGWWFLLLAFIHARKNPSTLRLTALYVAGLVATLIKTQGVLFPILLIIGRIAEKGKSSVRDPILWVLAISMIPMGIYALTQPAVAAAFLSYGGTSYGFSNIIERLFQLGSAWWHWNHVIIVVGIISLPFLIKVPWHISAMLLAGVLTSYLLGPGHSYYTTHLIVFAVPISIMIKKMGTWKVPMICGVLGVITLLTTGPSKFIPFPYSEFSKEGFWNEHSAKINEFFLGEDSITVLGSAGHHIRWYISPRVLVGKQFKPPYPTEYILLLNDSKVDDIDGIVEYSEKNITVMRQTNFSYQDHY